MVETKIKKDVSYVKIKIITLQLILGFVLSTNFFACNLKEAPRLNESINLTIFHVNDQHGRLENFAKIKHIVDNEADQSNVLLVSAGDIFSGNPVVDNYPQKGLPIIDIMNQTGFDISTIGNHEFDYGEDHFKNRLSQASFEWVCANVDMSNSVIDQPAAYHTIVINELKITFLGLLETNGSKEKTIPSTHPWKIKNITFERPENVVSQYSNIKDQEDSDLFVALTHLGHDSYNPDILGDYDLAEQFPYFDMIIGGHTNLLLDTAVNNIPIFMAGNDLNYLGKIKVAISNKSVKNIDFELIDLNAYADYDEGLMNTIEEYNSYFPFLDDEIGFSEIHHYRWDNVGCFYTEALRVQLNVDISLQNRGGIRADLNQGEITRREIYAMDPFNNGTLIYTLTVKEIKEIIKGTQMGIYYSGVVFEKQDGHVVIKDDAGNVLEDTKILTLGINDYIPAVYESYFTGIPLTQPFTTAEVIITYLENNAIPVNYPNCNRYFKFN